MFRRWGFLILGTLAAAAVIGSSAGAHTQAKQAVFPMIDVSSNAGVAKLLISHGISPKGVVIQRGSHNYAGPSCPGITWTCTTATRVVQFSTKKGSDNQFQCSAPSTDLGPDTCTIFQSSSGGTNDARCVEKSTASVGLIQKCNIRQTNTTGDNRVRVQQEADANGGPVQDVTQYAGVVQVTGAGGSNDAQIHQDLEQSTKDSAGGTQTQDGHQGVSLEQDSVTGDNHANIDQSAALKAKITGKAGAVNQMQDTATSNVTTCPGSPCPNANVGITQDSTSGNNDAEVNQSNNLSASAPKNSTGSQTQGEPGGGLNSHMIDQLSSGLSTYELSQHEHQDLDPNKPGSGLSQTQWGPMWGGSPQGTNTGDVFNVDQNSVQNAGKGANQDDQAYGNCDTTGNCQIDQHINQNGTNANNSCTATGFPVRSCHIGLIVSSTSEGGPTTCGGSGPETSCDTSESAVPPTPPPPPGD